MTGGALGSHILYCKVSPNSSESPKKKIAIQIRKDYKKEEKKLISTPKGENSTKSSVSPSKLDLLIQARIKELCIVNRLLCIPCNRTYNTVTILKRHAAQHLSWTRFGCSLCSFRSYDKYLSVQHCISEHKYPLKDVDNAIVQDDKIGEYKFYLSTNPSNKNGNYIKSESISGIDAENDHGSGSSDCSASVLSEDSIKKEIEDHDDTESSNGLGSVVEGESKFPHNENLNGVGEKDAERPQRTRKLMEQKDFVYEPLKLVMSLPRCDDLKSDQNNSSRTRVSTYERSSSKKRKAFSPISESKRKISSDIFMKKSKQQKNSNDNNNDSSNSPLKSEVDGKNVKLNTIQVVSCDKDNMLKLKIQNKILTSTLNSAPTKTYSKTSSEIKLSKDSVSTKAADQEYIKCLEMDSSNLAEKTPAKNVNTSENKKSSQANNIESEVSHKLKRVSDVKQKEKSKPTERTSSPSN